MPLETAVLCFCPKEIWGKVKIIGGKKVRLRCLSATYKFKIWTTIQTYRRLSAGYAGNFCPTEKVKTISMRKKPTEPTCKGFSPSPNPKGYLDLDQTLSTHRSYRRIDAWGSMVDQLPRTTEPTVIMLFFSRPCRNCLLLAGRSILFF